MTDDRSAFERQLSARLERMAGPEPDVDVAASVRAATTPSPKWRFPRMFSAAKLFVAGAVVAAFGGYLLVDVIDRSHDPITAGAQTVGASCPEAAALLDARESGEKADPSLISQVQLEPFGADTADEDSATTDETDGYARVVFDIDGIPVEADDERLNGLFSGEVTGHFFTEDGAYMAGLVRIDNGAGSWSGEIRGFATDAGDRLHFEFVGEGAYAGCAVSLQGNFEGDDFSGIVFPAPTITDA